MLESVWRDPSFKVSMRKETRELSSATVKLDLNNPTAFVRYLICLAHPIVANSWSERGNRTEYEYVLRDRSKDAKVELDINEIKGRVTSKLYQLFEKKDSKTLFTTFNLLLSKVRGYKISYANLSSKSPASDFYNELLLNLDKDTAKLKALDGIMKQDGKILENYRAFFAAVEKGILTEIQNNYFYQTDEIGSLEDAVRWLGLPEQREIAVLAKQTK